MKNQNELFIVEHENGEWIDATGDGGWSCWTTRPEAQDALDSEADEEPTSAYRIVRFVRESGVPGTPLVVGVRGTNTKQTMDSPAMHVLGVPGKPSANLMLLTACLKPNETLADIAEELEHVANQPLAEPLRDHAEALQISLQFAADKLKQYSAREPGVPGTVEEERK